MKEDGTLVAEGDILVRPKMAVTLQRIADDPLAFYDPTSQLAQDIVADIAEYGIIFMLFHNCMGTQAQYLPSFLSVFTPVRIAVHMWSS